MKSASCADEEAFLEKGEGAAKRRDLQLELEALRRSQPLLASGEGQALRDEMGSVTDEEAQARLQELSDEGTGAQEKVEGLVGELRSVQDRRTVVESSNPAEEIQFEIAESVEKIEQGAHEWAVLSIAEALLRKARDDYQREKQGPLLQSASKHFAQFTCDRYSGVESVLEEERIRIVDPLGRTKDVPQELSGGTAEQLYLAMRFALIDEYSSNSEPMPVLLDDVMVNFDPQRAQAACGGIVGLSTRHQVIVLTCNPETVERLNVACTEAGVPQPYLIEIEPTAIRTAQV